jgi:hypothetical protein
MIFKVKINTKFKLLNAAIWFSRVCRYKNLKTSCVNIKIGGSGSLTNRIKIIASKVRTNNEITFLCIKNQNINND